MTIVNRKHERVLLSHHIPQEFWNNLHEHYAGRNRVRWMRLAMLSLRINGNWPIENIAFLFKRDKGSVSRLLEHLKRQLRDRFDCEFHPCHKTSRRQCVRKTRRKKRVRGVEI